MRPLLLIINKKITRIDECIIKKGHSLAKSISARSTIQNKPFISCFKFISGAVDTLYFIKIEYI
jgi:hypothetical protein